MVRAGHPRDRLLHQRAAKIVHAPTQALGSGVESHLHPARLKVGDRLAERKPEDGGVLEVVVGGDLLDAVGPPEQRVERDEAERHELGEAARALLKLSYEPHVLGQFPRFLDVSEHDRYGERRQDLCEASMSRSAMTGSCWGEISWRTRREAPPRRAGRRAQAASIRYSNTSSGDLPERSHMKCTSTRVGVRGRGARFLPVADTCRIGSVYSGGIPPCMKIRCSVTTASCTLATNSLLRVVGVGERLHYPKPQKHSRLQMFGSDVAVDDE